MRVDGEILDITAKMQVDRFKIHDIEVVIDRIVPEASDRFRIGQSVNIALKEGKGIIMVQDENARQSDGHTANPDRARKRPARRMPG